METPIPSRTKHRRETLRLIIAPLAGAGIVTIVVMVLLLIGFSETQLGTVAACMSVLIFIPLIATCLIPYALMLVLIFGTGKLYGSTSSILYSLRRVNYFVHQFVLRFSQAISTPVIRLNQGVAWVEAMLRYRGKKELPERVEE